MDSNAIVAVRDIGQEKVWDIPKGTRGETFRVVFFPTHAKVNMAITV